MSRISKIGFKDEILSRPWLMGLISILASYLLYTAFVPILNISEPDDGLPMVIGIPAIVAPACTWLIGRYIKQIKKQHEALEELNNTNKKLLSILSHDLRAPIASLKSVLDLVVSQELSEIEAKAMLSDLSSKTEHLLQFMNDILNWSQRQSNLKPLKKEVISLKESIHFTVTLFEEHRQQKNIELKLDELKGFAFVDKGTFSFAFRNIYQNALKFTPLGGKIEIYTEQQNGHCLISIEDNGAGMNSEELEKVLDPQQWYSKAGTNNEQGTGFGLTSSINYLREGGGNIIIESEVGKGSKFSIVLPRTKT